MVCAKAHTASGHEEAAAPYVRPDGSQLGIAGKLREWGSMVSYAVKHPRPAFQAACRDFETKPAEPTMQQARSLTATALKLLLRNIRALVQVSLMWFVLNVLFSIPFTTIQSLVEPAQGGDLGAAIAADIPAEGFSLSMSSADAQAEAMMEARARELGGALARGPQNAAPTTAVGQITQMITSLIDWATQAGGRASAVIVMWLDPGAGAVVRRSKAPTGANGRGATHVGTHAGKGRVLTAFGGSTPREITHAPAVASASTNPVRRQWDAACHAFLTTWKRLGSITETEALYNIELLGLGIASLPCVTFPWTAKRATSTALSQVVTALNPSLAGRAAITRSREMMRGTRSALALALPMTVVAATLACILGATVLSVVASCAVGTAAGYLLDIGTADGIGAALGIFGVLAGTVVRATPFLAMRAVLYAAWARNGGRANVRPMAAPKAA